MAVKIVTDSTADLSRELAVKYDISVIPLNVHFGDEVYKDGVDLASKDFFTMLEEREELPKTSQPTAGDFVELYNSIAAAGDRILSLHISSEISGTCQSAELAANMVDSEVKVVDSRSVSLGLGLIAIEAGRAAQEGRELDEICRLIAELQSRLSLYFTVDTLEYLHKGGRLSRAQKVVGSILSIRPIIAMEEGRLYVAEKTRGRKRAFRKILANVEKEVGHERASFAIAHGNVPAEAERMAERLKSRFEVEELYINTIGPVVGTHGGPGAVGVFTLPAG